MQAYFMFQQSSPMRRVFSAVSHHGTCFIQNLFGITCYSTPVTAEHMIALWYMKKQTLTSTPPGAPFANMDK